MKCQILFSGKNKKNIISLSSAENAQRVVKVKSTFSKNLSGILSECQIVWIQILLGLIWVQTICNGYQLTTKVAGGGERVKKLTLVLLNPDMP